MTDQSWTPPKVWRPEQGDEAAEFLDAASYRHLNRWARQIGERPAVQRGKRINRSSDNNPGLLRERHDARDFENPGEPPTAS